MINFTIFSIKNLYNVFCLNFELLSYYYINQFLQSVAFHIETSHLFHSANQTAGFYMNSNTRLKWVMGLPSNQKVPNCNSVRHSAKLMEPTSLQGFQ